MWTVKYVRGAVGEPASQVYGRCRVPDRGDSYIFSSPDFLLSFFKNTSSWKDQEANVWTETMETSTR